MKTLYVNKKANNHVNLYENEKGETISDLISYSTQVASYNHKTKVLEIEGYFSKTTATHINDFLNYCGLPSMNKKEIENFAKQK